MPLHLPRFLPGLLRRWGASVGALVVLGCGTATAQITSPAYNWKLPVFTNEGYRSMVASGTQAQAKEGHEFEVIDLYLSMFSGDASAQLENVILSPAATFEPNARRAHGEKSVRFIGKGVEASGTRWIYFHGEKKISLDGAVRVTFNAELKDLLK